MFRNASRRSDDINHRREREGNHHANDSQPGASLLMARLSYPSARFFSLLSRQYQSLYSKRNQTVLALHKPAPKSLQGRHRGWADSQQIDRQHSILLSLLSSRQLLYSLLLRQSVRVRLIFIRAMINVNTVLFQSLRLSKRRMGKREREF